MGLKRESRSLWDRLKTFYLTIDLRTLGLFRILFSSGLIVDWFLRWPNLEAFYTSFGLLPIDAPLPKAGGDFHFSLLDGFTSLPMVQIFFILGLICYLLFCVGYRTKLFQILSFLFFISVSNRNVLIRDGGDQMMICMAFWALFLPVGKRFSLDAIFTSMREGVELDPKRRLERERAEPIRSEPSLAAFALVAQIAITYLGTALSKSGLTWQDGSAIYYALHFDPMVSHWGEIFRRQPLWVLKGFTWSGLFLEYAAAPLILFPFWQPALRRIGWVALTGLQLGIFTFMAVGIFQPIMIASSVVIFMTEDWEWMKRFLLRWSFPVVAYFDDSCGFCTLCCQLLAIADIGGNITFIGNSDEKKFRHKLSRHDLQDSIIVYAQNSNEKRIRSAAFAALFRALPLPFHLLCGIAFSGVREFFDRLYDKIAYRRQRISRALGLAACGIAPPEKSQQGFSPTSPLQRTGRWWGNVAANGVVALILLPCLINAYNINLARHHNLQPLPENRILFAPLNAMQLFENWELFSPNPTRDTGWWVIQGVTESGEAFDPLTGKQPIFDRPASLSLPYDHYWKKYFDRLKDRDYSDYRLYFGKYITRRNHRDKAAGKRLVKFDCYFLLQATLPPGSPEPFPIKRNLLWHHECFARP